MMANQIIGFLIIIATIVFSGYAIYLSRRLKTKKEEEQEST